MAMDYPKQSSKLVIQNIPSSYGDTDDEIRRYESDSKSYYTPEKSNIIQQKSR